MKLRGTCSVLLGRSLLSVLLLGVIGAGVYFPARLMWAEAQYRAAQEAFRKRNFDQARLHLESYLAVQPNSHDGHFLLAQTSRRAGFFDEADVQLDICEYLRGVSEESQRERVLAKVQQGDLSYEEGLLRSAAGAGAGLIFEALVRGYQKNYLIGKMKERLGVWLEQEPDNIHALLQRAWVAERDNDHHQAVKDYSRVLVLDRENAEARLRRGQALLFLKQPADALKDLQELNRQKPLDATTGVALTVCLAKLGRTEEAGKLLDQLGARHPQNAAILLERGRLALEQGEPERAETWLEQAVARAPRDHATVYSYSLCLKRLGKETEWKKAVALVKDIEADLERMSELTRRLQQKPGDPNLRCEIGKIFFRAGEDKEGVLWLESALHSAPNHVAAHQALADYYARANDPTRAARHHRLAELPAMQSK
jgi:predicted Zn-dependent protease